MKRVLFHYDKTAQTWHRAFLPVKNLAPLLTDISVELDSELSLDYDCYVFQRQPLPSAVPWISSIKAADKKIIWSVDDDLWHLPEWNPASTYVDLDLVNWMRDLADEVWVSTDTLRNVVGRGIVLPNLIDSSFWPAATRTKNQPLRLLWGGSAYHDPDIEIVAGVFERLLERYQDVICLFFGSYPESMSQWVRIPGSNLAQMVPDNRYGGRLGYVPPVAIEEYPRTLLTLNPDICIAALADETFAHSKSNLKVLEMCMAGAATVASDLPPYNNEDLALLGDLYENVCWLIEDEEFRLSLGRQSQEEVKRKWTWTGPKKQLWADAIKAI